MALQLPYESFLRECGSKHLALYRAIRAGIAGGRLQPGERLPSTRQLAGLYGVSRGSVSLAYEMLAAEGYVRAGVGQGTFVSDEAAAPIGSKAVSPGANQRSRSEPEALSAWGRRVASDADEPASRGGDAGPANDDVCSFVPRGMGERWFPWKEWRSSVAAQWRKIGTGEEDADSAADGSLRLRQAIALRLRRERGIVCDAEDVVVTAGSQQAIALLSQLLLEEGRTAVAENPCYAGTRRAIAATGASLALAPVDGQGIFPADWDARLLFVTPTRQFPTGAVLKLERRLELLAWASRRKAWIVEDDYDSDFRWGGRPIEPLKSLDREGRVVYVGSFSRSMRTEVRIGYAVLPRALREPFARAKRLYDTHPVGIAEQLALAEWMADGGFDRHLRRSRRIFHRLQEQLKNGLEGRLGDLFEVAPADAGLFLFARWHGSREDYDRLARECRGRGVRWGDGRPYYAGDTAEQPPSALFGFAHLDEERIAEGLARIRQAAETLGLISLRPPLGRSAQRGSIG
ncbi:PLP-dependent aminotransferase family protein [Cohnella zeiphila]|uniref:MocR-like pyridoxine biosynthesis transcription factor PdxR n=1 Tax=Cohnella zeiphila TaxID=2761120 RepID=UPI003080D1D8